MRKLFFCVLLLGSIFSSAQQIQVFSAKDSLRVPFATLLINGDLINYSKTGSDDGVIAMIHVFEDSVLYQVTIQSFGFDRVTKKYYGSQIKKIEKIYLVPSDIHLDEVVITAQYEPTATEKSVQKIKVIDQEKIRQMGAVNLRDVLSNQLNVRLQQDNVLGSGLTMQGLSGMNVKILMDGVPVIGRLDGNIDLSQINMNNVERIEVIEGPLSVQYGTNALAGTINIITKKGLQKKISAGVTSYYESIGTYNLNIDLACSYKKHNLQLNGGRNYFDGWNYPDDPFFTPREHIADSTRFKQWKPKEQYFANLAYQYALKKSDIGFKSAYFDEVIINRGYPRAPYAENTFDDYYYTKRIDNSLSFKAKLAGNWSFTTLSAYNYYNRIKKTLYKDLTTLAEKLSENSSDQDTSNFSLVMTRGSFVHVRPVSKMNYELGYDLNYESAFGKRIDKNLQYMGDYALFATSEYKPVTPVVVKPGLRYAYNTVYKTPLVPSLNIKYTATDRHTFRGSYARGFRAPTIKELYFLFVDINHNIIGNRELKAEQSDNFSLSYNYNRDIKKCRVKFDLSFFYNSIFNKIDLAMVSGTSYSYVNIGRYKTYGLQLGNNLNFKKLAVQTGFNYSARYNNLSEEEKVPEYTYSPEVLANATYKIKKNINLAVFYKYTGVLPGYRKDENNVITQTFVSDYSVMDVTTNWILFKDRATITFGCKNVLDVKNINSTSAAAGAHNTATASIPVSTGRNYFIKLALNFSKD